MRLHIEIRPGEGGDDARALVREQARIYAAHAQREGLSLEVLGSATAGNG